MDGNLNALTTIFTEFYYWVTVVFMFLIHVGFCLYEVSASRHKNHMHTLMKNVMMQSKNFMKMDFSRNIFIEIIYLH